MSAIWIFLFLVPVFRGLCEFGADFKDPVLWPLLGTLLAGPFVVIAPKNQAGWAWFRKGAGLVAVMAAVVLLRRSNLHLLDTRNGTEALLLAAVGLGALGAALPQNPKEGAARNTWAWIAGWTLTGLLNPWLPVLGAALGTCLQAWAPPVPAAPEPAREPGLPLFLGALFLGLALPKPFFDWGFALRADLSLAAFALAVLVMVALPPRLREVPNWVPLVGLGLLTTLYCPPFPMASSAVLGWLTGLALPRLAARPRLLGGGVFLGLVLSFVLHSNLQVALIRAWAWWSA